MRQSGLQHHQWRPVPLERDVAKDRPVLRDGDGSATADVSQRGDGGQGSALVQDEGEIRARRSSL
ncbi:hypothetical protein D3C87_1995090 [compost metagenome]